MHKTISFLVLSFLASFAAACVSVPVDDAAVDVDVETAAAVDSSVSARAGDTDDLTCPAAGTCQKASYYCNGDPSNSWCQILTRCIECNTDLAVEDTDSARAGSDSDNLTCPGAGTCEKASTYCNGDPNNSWCKILATCNECGIDIATGGAAE
jgi:hypothetical protein